VDAADQVSQHWPCPKCGCNLFYSVLSFERGFEDEAGRFIHFYPPAAIAVDVDLDNVRCAQCRHKFSLSDEYALGEPPEWIELLDDCKCGEDDCECVEHAELEIIEDSGSEPETEPEPEL